MTDNNTTLSARERILAKIRASRPEAVGHPEVPVFPIAGDPISNFISHVEGFDGNVIEINSRDEALAWLRDNIKQSDDALVYSGIDGYEGNITLGQLPTRQDAEKLSASVGEGILGIGETGSILVAPEVFGQMSNGLLAINLYLLLSREKIFPGLQEAYAQMDLSKVQYSSLFSGPSATADIEAVHITGAQGPVSLTVLLY